MHENKVSHSCEKVERKEGVLGGVEEGKGGISRGNITHKDHVIPTEVPASL
jgi:hypothetical protein